MSRGRKTNAKGRSSGTRPFVMLPWWIFDSEAYRCLKPGPRALLWELIRRYNGTNNGRIGFSQRHMATALGLADRQTVADYVRELEAKGFIKAMRRGGFNVKVSDRRATEWALTWEKVGEELATKDFMRWPANNISGVEKPSSKDGNPAPVVARDLHDCSNVREFPSHKVRPIAVGRAG